MSVSTQCSPVMGGDQGRGNPGQLAGSTFGILRSLAVGHSGFVSSHCCPPFKGHLQRMLSGKHQSSAFDALWGPEQTSFVSGDRATGCCPLAGRGLTLPWLHKHP